MEYFLQFIVLLSVHSLFESRLFVMVSLVCWLLSCQFIDSVALTLKCYKFAWLLSLIYIHVFINFDLFSIILTFQFISFIMLLAFFKGADDFKEQLHRVVGVTGRLMRCARL